MTGEHRDGPPGPAVLLKMVIGSIAGTTARFGWNLLGIIRSGDIYVNEFTLYISAPILYKDAW